MSGKTGPRKLGCTNCGNLFEVYPPDDRHNVATRNIGDYSDNVKMEYKCERCNQKNIIYWGAPGVTFVSRRRR